MHLGGLLFLLLLDSAIEAWAVATTGLTGLKAGKNILYVLMSVAIIVQVIRHRRWREFTTAVDLALLGFVAALTISALLADVGVAQAGQGAYVYVRGAVVFYALRVLRPDGRWIRPASIAVVAWAGLNATVAIVQVAVGPAAYTALGWHDLKMAAIHRAQGLYAHPNDLGHMLGLTVIGLVTWLAVKGWRWPIAAMLMLCAAGLAASQSRESLLGVCGGVLILALMLRLRVRRVLAVIVAIGLLAALPLAILPGARTEVARRAAGLGTALGVDVPRPAPDLSLPECGPPPPAHTPRGSACRRAEPEQEIRVLFARQSFRLWQRSPVVGFGPGTFGGSVALAQDPQWNRHPRLGPEGFELHGFHGRTVDSFLLHLTTETGGLGLAAFLVWLFLLSRPPTTRKSSVWAAMMPAAVVFALTTAVFSNGLEGPSLPPLFFGVAGLAWAAREDQQPARLKQAFGLRTNAPGATGSGESCGS